MYRAGERGLSRSAAKGSLGQSRSFQLMTGMIYFVSSNVVNRRSARLAAGFFGVLGRKAMFPDESNASRPAHGLRVIPSESSFNRTGHP
jgi:hypothetical protein